MGAARAPPAAWADMRPISAGAYTGNVTRARWGAERLFLFSPAAAGAGDPFYLLFAYFSHWN